MDSGSSKLREKFDLFRILIIGRANPGKATILQRVCKTRENPETYNSAGEKVQFMIPVVTRMMKSN
jgi:GTP-binding protein EngB required for normal cell division